jgi:DNA-binding transcriptional LysR family regulator
LTIRVTSTPLINAARSARGNASSSSPKKLRSAVTRRNAASHAPSALTIGVAGPVDHRLAETLGDFHRAHPAIEIVVTREHNKPLLAAVADGAMDAAVVGVGAQAPPPDVRARVVAVEPLVLAIRHDHPLSRRKTIALGELREHPLISLTRGSGLRTLLENACRDAGFSPRITVETGELPSLVELAAEGLGAAVVPRSAAAEADVAVVRITRPRLQRRTALAWNRASTSPAGRAFLTLAERRFSAGRSDAA